jgi:hypothetical protein
MTHVKILPRTLALCVTTRGISFMCFVHPSMVIDWGARHIFSTDKARHTDTLQAAKQIIDNFCPTVLVIENVEDGYSKRSPRMKPLYRAIAAYGEKKKMAVDRYSRRDIKDVFLQTGATNKHHVNCAIVQILPALKSYQPPERKNYQNEPSEQGMFDAAALGFVFFVRTRRFKIMKAMQEELPIIEA